jgi:hypothetical protein
MRNARVADGFIDISTDMFLVTGGKGGVICSCSTFRK